MDLHLVEHPCLDRMLRDVSAAHLDVPIPGSGLRLCHGAFDAVGHVGHQRVVPPGGRAGRPVTGYEDRGAVVVTAPVIHELGGPPPCEDGTGGVPLGFELSGRPPAANQSWSSSPLSPPRKSWGSAMYPSSDIDMSRMDVDTSTSSGLKSGGRHLSGRRTADAGF